MFQWLNIFPLHKELEKQLSKICLKYYCLYSESKRLEKGGKERGATCSFCHAVTYTLHPAPQGQLKGNKYLKIQSSFVFYLAMVQFHFFTFGFIKALTLSTLNF